MCFQSIISNVTNNRKKALKNCLKNLSIRAFVLPVLFITLLWHFERLFSCFNQFYGSSQGLNFRDTAVHLGKPCVSYTIQQRPAGTGLAGKTLTIAPIKIYSKKNPTYIS